MSHSWKQRNGLTDLSSSRILFNHDLTYFLSLLSLWACTNDSACQAALYATGSMEESFSFFKVFCFFFRKLGRKKFLEIEKFKGCGKIFFRAFRYQN